MNKKYGLSEETISMLEQISVAEFIDLLSKYPVVTRKLLLIRPKVPGDDSWNFSYDAAGDRLGHPRAVARPIGIMVKSSP